MKRNGELIPNEAKVRDRAGRGVIRRFPSLAPAFAFSSGVLPTSWWIWLGATLYVSLWFCLFSGRPARWSISSLSFALGASSFHMSPAYVNNMTFSRVFPSWGVGWSVLCMDLRQGFFSGSCSRSAHCRRRSPTPWFVRWFGFGGIVLLRRGRSQIINRRRH